jgi:hypothetical protein
VHPAEQFLSALDPNTDKFLFVTFGDRLKDHSLTRQFYGSFDTYKEELVKLNNLGAGIFVTINKTKGNRRKKEDIIQARAIWQEDDTNAGNLLGLEPNIVIESSPDHFHRYWFLSSEARTALQDNLPKVEQMQYRMAEQFGSDPGAKDLARVLRLPGFYNNKRDDPHKVVILETNPGSYQADELIHAILGAEPDKVDPAPEEQADGALTDYINQIMLGEHLHTPLRAIMLLNANKGMDQAYNKVVCTGLINSCPDKDRARKAYHDLDAMLAATYKKVSDEVPEPLEGILPQEYDIDWPPGRMGELARAANEFFAIPNKPAAIMTALATVAGITGRRYNISDSGLNMYITVMMPTGSGKDSIRKFIDRVLKNEKMLGTNGASFIGPRAFTGPAALNKRLQKQPSIVCVMTEAGFLYKSEAGDKAGLTAMILAAYSSSGKYNGLEGADYTAKDDSLPYLQAPSLTIFNEGTPHTLHTELNQRQSIKTGELPRMWVLNLDDIDADPNRVKHKLNLSPQLLARIKSLLLDCYSVQNSDMPDVIDIEIPEQFFGFELDCRQQVRSLKHSDESMSSMWTRAAQKTLTVAALLSTLNSPDQSNPEIQPQDWDWAQQLHRFEFAQLPSLFRQDSGMLQPMEDAMRIIDKLLRQEYKSRNTALSPELVAAAMFTESVFKVVAQNHSTITNLESSHRYGNPQPGWRIVLNYLQSQGFIAPRKGVTLRGRGRSPKMCWQITDDFSTYFNNHVQVTLQSKRETSIEREVRLFKEKHPNVETE